MKVVDGEIENGFWFVMSKLRTNYQLDTFSDILDKLSLEFPVNEQNGENGEIEQNGENGQTVRNGPNLNNTR